MGRLDGKLILIADDEISLRELLSDELAFEGATTLQASNAFEALVTFKTNAIDAVISDVRMDGGDGIILLDKLRAIHPSQPPLFFISGFTDTLQEAYEKGAEAVCLNPLNSNKLPSG